MNLANEGLEARKKDEDVAIKKRKAEEDKHWEGALSFVSAFRRMLIFVSLNRQQRISRRQLAVVLQGYEEEEES